MIEKKRIEEASRNVRQYIVDGLLKKERQRIQEARIFLHGSGRESLRTASVIFELSTYSAAKDAMRLERDYESHEKSSPCDIAAFEYRSRHW